MIPFFESLKNYFKGGKGFGMFSGVFVPTFLSIIGVILFLRLGFIVGSAGIFYTILIILLSISVTLTTALALSSITTTIRIGAGGAFSIVSKTLGLEVGGSVGIPLVLAQIFSVVFYIFGFTEGLALVFPDVPARFIATGVLLILFILTFISTRIAVRTQTIVFLFILAALFSVFAGGGDWWTKVLHTPLYTSPADFPFWGLFALFFPAATGLMTGIGLSGELSNPKRQIPRGVLWAIGTTALIYIAATFWLGHTSTPEELLSDNLIMVKKAFNSQLVLIGILAATFSSALTTFVAAPRLLQALAESSIIPMGHFFSKKSQQGEPRRAVLFVTLIILIAIFLGNLDSIAPLLTMFFLITYAMIDVAVFTEMALGLVSFRPTFRIPKFIPLYGLITAVLFMFLINPFAGFIAVFALFAIYAFLVQKHLQAKEGDVRSGLFVMIAEWAAKRILKLSESTELTWKPNILIPVIITRTLLGNFPLIKAIAYPSGTMTVLGVNLKKAKKVPDADDLTGEEIEEELRELPSLVKKFDNEGIFTSSSVIEVDDYTEGIAISLGAMKSQVFHPNILFLPFKAERLPKKSLEELIVTAREEGVGTVIFDRDEELALGSQEDIHVWIAPTVLEMDFYDFHTRKFDLSLLIAYQLCRNWKGRITLWMCTTEELKNDAAGYLRKLVYEARLPSNTSVKVSTDSFKATLKKAPEGDIHIISVSEQDMDFILDMSKAGGHSYLFVADSNREDILA